MPPRKFRHDGAKVAHFSRRRPFRDEAIWINNHICIYIYRCTLLKLNGAQELSMFYPTTLSSGELAAYCCVLFGI